MKYFLTLVLLLSTLDAFAGFGSRSSSSRSSFSSSRSSFSRSSSSSYSRPSSSFFSRSSSSSSSVSRPTVFRPATTGFSSAPKSYTAPKIIPLRTIAPLSPRKTVVAPTVISRPSVSVTPRVSGYRTVTVPQTRVVTRTVVRTQPRYYHNNHYYSYPSVSLSNMMLTAALINAARQDWTYTAIHIANQTPSRVCKCDSLGRIYSCGLFRDEEDYVCKQFRVLDGDEVEWR
jgi:hypothetical protein